MTAEQTYNLNFRRLALLWLPTALRKTAMSQWCFVLVSPLEKMFPQLCREKKQSFIKLRHNYQKFSLRKRLNDAFDSAGRRIRIVKARRYDALHIFTEAEDDAIRSKTQWLYGDENPLYLYTEEEINEDYDFIVEIPDTGIDQVRLRAEIDFYALQSKRYKIVITP